MKTFKLDKIVKRISDRIVSDSIYKGRTWDNDSRFWHFYYELINHQPFPVIPTGMDDKKCSELIKKSTGKQIADALEAAIFSYGWDVLKVPLDSNFNLRSIDANAWYSIRNRAFRWLKEYKEKI